MTKLFHDILNPFAVSGSVWMLCAGISQLHLSNMSINWCIETHIAVHIFFYVVMLCGIFFANKEYKSFDKRQQREKNIEFTNNFKLAYFTLVVVVLSCCLLEWRANDFVITILDTTKSGDLKIGLKTLKGIHYFVVTLPYCALISFFCIVYDKKQRILHVLIIIFAICYIVFFAVSRGTLLIILLGMLLIYHSKRYLNVMHLIVFGIAMLGMLSIIMIIRLQNNSSLVFTAVESNQYLSLIYTAIETPFTNLNQLINNGSPYTFIYASILRPLCQVLRIELDVPYLEYNTIFFNARPIIYGFYHDLGLLGVLIYSVIIYTIVGLIYIHARKSIKWILLLAALQKAIYVPFFGNYFTGSIATSFPFFVIFLLAILIKTRPSNSTCNIKGIIYNE